MNLFETMGIENMDSHRIMGVVPAIVTNNKDPEGLGRVKLKFPWFSDDNETDWVRVATFMAGSEMGGYFIPEVGDEVLVAFEHGNINAPYVIGALWNAKQKPPEKNPDGKNNIRKFRSRSGHEIVFNDNDVEKKEKIEIHTGAGHKIILDDATGGEKIEIADKTGANKIIIDSVKNSITIECRMELRIKAQIVEIEATSSLTLKSNALLNIQGMPVKIN